MMPDYAKLIERLEAASEIDEQLAADIAALFLGEPFYPTVYGLALRLTDEVAAIGAALALVEKVLPGWSWSIHAGPKGSLVYLCRDWNDDYAPTFRSRETKPKRQTIFEKQEPDSKTPPLAILLAMLRALQSQEKPDV